jgi:uncharacterized protein YjbJ (UPF0337 family)
MTNGDKDRIEGGIDEIKGRAKSAWGNVTGDDQIKVEGEIEQIKGKARQALGDLKDKAGKIVDDLDRSTRSDSTGSSS